MKKNLKLQKLLKHILAVTLCIIIVFEVSVTTKADTTLTITSTNTKYWTLKRSYTRTDYNRLRTRKTVTAINKYTGNIHNTATYAITDNHYHKKGCRDLTSSISVSSTYTFSTSVSAGIQGFGAELGYSYSATSGNSVSNALPRNKASGYYYYGVYAKYIDMKLVTRKDVYKKKKGKYKLDRKASGTTIITGTQLYTPNHQKALYYKWYKAK